MIDTHEYGGFWWLPQRDPGIPSDDSERLGGTLTVTRGKAELVVLGSFGHEQVGSSGLAFSPAPADFPRILGFTTKGKAITLEDCTRTNFQLNFPGIPSTTYRPRVVLIDAWFGEEEDVLFDEIAIRTSRLDTWVGVSGFSEDRDVLQSGGSLRPGSFLIQFEKPEPITIPLDGGEEACIRFGFQHSGRGPVQTEVGLKQTSSLCLRFSSPQPLEQIFSRVAQLRNFLTLAAGRTDTLLSVHGFKDDYLHPKTESRQPVTLLWEVPYNPNPPARSVHPRDMLFTLPQADPNISDVMKAWFERQGTFGPVLSLYFGMLDNPDIFVDLRFLTYAQAVETYDFRRRDDPFELPRSEHRERMRQILEGAPEEWRTWLNEKLAGSNFRTLDRRIRDVLGECPDVSAKIVGATPADLDHFVRRFKRSRNYYTHYTPDLERHAAKGVALYLMVVQLRAILEMSLLRELGFSCEAIDRILERVERYREIQHVRAAALQQE